MKKTLFIGLVAVCFSAMFVFSGCKKDDDETLSTPPYAASTKTWKFGGLTWSDVIHDPACNKQDFDGGTKDNPLSDGRSYNSYYYYSWHYMIEHAATLCPSPWRVPSEDDVDILMEDVSLEQIALAWGVGGFALGSNVYDAYSFQYLWSNSMEGLYFGFGFGDYSYNQNNQDALPGFQVRCVCNEK
jgi:hypothetical protein